MNSKTKRTKTKTKRYMTARLTERVYKIAQDGTHVLKDENEDQTQIPIPKSRKERKITTMRTIYSITPEISSFVPFLLGDGPSSALYLRRRIYLLNFLDVLSGSLILQEIRPPLMDWYIVGSVSSLHEPSLDTRQYTHAWSMCRNTGRRNHLRTRGTSIEIRGHRVRDGLGWSLGRDRRKHHRTLLAQFLEDETNYRLCTSWGRYRLGIAAHAASSIRKR